MTKILICGGRNCNAEKVRLWLRNNFFNCFPLAHEIISGEARGADTGAKLFAVNDTSLIYTGIAADWENYPRTAGPIRNQQMLKLGPHAILAFPGGSGTNHMVKISTQKFIPAWKVIGDFT